MASVDFQMFALTLLSFTPSRFNQLAANNDPPRLGQYLGSQTVNFSPEAIAQAQNQFLPHLTRPLTADESIALGNARSVRDAMFQFGKLLSASFPFYDPTSGIHPSDNEVTSFVAVMRQHDESLP